MEQTATEPLVFQNDEVRFSVHFKPGCIVEFDVEAFTPLIAQARQKAIKHISKEVSLPGFRKGKAPQETVAKQFAPQIEKQQEQTIGDFAFQACAKLCSIRPLDRDTKISYRLKSRSSEGALLNLSFEIAPRIPTVDPKRLQLKDVKRPDETPDKIHETIRQIQLFFAHWQTVDNRPVQQGDFVLLDVDIIEETPPTSLFSNTRFEVAEKSMSKWMYDLVLGKNKGDAVEGISIPDESASEEDKEQLKPKKVLVTIQAIDQATIPEMNGDFLQKIGVTTEDELYTNITHLLNKQADAHVLEEQRKQATDFLLNHNPFDLPSSLIEKETRFRLQQLMQDKEFLNYWKSLDQDTHKKTITTIYQQSEKAVRLFYICRQVLTDAQITISTQDIPPPVSSPLELMLDPHKMFQSQRTPEIEHAEAFSRLILEKAEDYVIAQATKAENL